MRRWLSALALGLSLSSCGGSSGKDEAVGQRNLKPAEAAQAFVGKWAFSGYLVTGDETFHQETGFLEIKSEDARKTWSRTEPLSGMGAAGQGSWKMEGDTLLVLEGGPDGEERYEYGFTSVETPEKEVLAGLNLSRKEPGKPLVTLFFTLVKEEE